MAQLNKLRERTVAFFEVVSEESGSQLRMSQIAWDKFLDRLAISTVDERTFEGESTWVGSVAALNAENHLLLHRVKDGAEWLSFLDWNTGATVELEESARRGLLDTSVVCFLNFGNVIGIMQGATSAPTHKQFERWLNGLEVFPSKKFVVRPLIAHAEIERMRTAHGASRIEIRIGRSKLAALNGLNGRLAKCIRVAGEEYGDVNVTLVISVPQGGARHSDRERLLADLREMEEVMPGAAEKAKASLVYAEAGGPEYTKLVEFVEHHITAKRKVPAVDDEGKSIRILSGVDAILGVAAEHEDELRLASGSADS